ncbi:MAG: methionyl-tRNA formyltransferase [Myxococcales bacterium]|nr:methionyl-tRNA formyltransferase [Myxococcales bacterium]
MRVVFFGTPDFAVPTLRALHGAGHTIELVVAQPSRPAGRGKALRDPPVAEAARELGLPLAQPRAIHSGTFADRYTALAPDVAVVIAYGRILKPLHLHTPRHGAVNLHASLLPRWRGAAPIQAALLAGDTETGVCAQRMEEGLDTGDVYLERRIPIDPRETGGTLHDKLAALSAEVAVATLARLGELEPVPQPEEGVCWAPKIEKVDGQLDLAQDAADLDRRIRAMTPWPGGWIAGAKGPLKVLEARPVDGEGTPGTVITTEPLTVACGRGALELTSLQTPGKKPVSGRDFANGRHLRAHDPLWS